MSQSPPCSGCREPLPPTDRFCRHCGTPAAGTQGPVQELYQCLAESVPFGAFVFDPSGRVRYWNRGMEEQTGTRRREVIGRTLLEVLPYLAPYAYRIDRALESAAPVRLERVAHLGRHGTELIENFWFRSVLPESGSGAILGVMEDITGQVRVDDRLLRSERLAAIGELAAGVAHNFNNILAAIGGDAQLLKLLAEEEELPAPVQEAAQQIYEETMRGGRIAHDLLSFARGAEPHLERLNIRELITDTLRLIGNHPAARSVTIETEIPPELPLVEADRNQLHQVFFNLILNAIQSMPTGGQISIGAVLRGDERDPTAGVLDVKLHDAGVGIPREHLPRIFDPFFSRRADGSTGSGLGLPVSLAMVQGLGGDIQITSALGIGTTVTVTLPIVERRSAPRTPQRRPQRGRALLVDDDAHVRRTLTTLLHRRGFEVEVDPDGEQSLCWLQDGQEKGSPDVVVMELQLPRRDGLETIRRFRDHDPALPIIILTAVTDGRRLREAMDHGAVFGFGKPPNYAELLAAVETCLRARVTGPRQD